MQKGRLLAGATAIALTLGLFSIEAPRAAASGANIDGVGGGSINLPSGRKFIQFAFSAQTGSTGDFGSFRFTINDPLAPLDAHVAVDCLNVFPFPPGAGGWVGGSVS